MRLVLCCGCGTKTILNEETAGSRVACRCGTHLDAPPAEELTKLPVRSDPLTPGEIRLIRWPSTPRLLLTDLPAFLCGIGVVLGLSFFVSSYFFHYDLPNRTKIAPKNLAETNQRYAIVAGVAVVAAPFGIWRVWRLLHLVDKGLLWQAEFVSRGTTTRHACRMDIAYEVNGKRFQKAMTVSNSICNRAEKAGSIDILIDAKNPSRYVLAPHAVTF